MDIQLYAEKVFIESDSSNSVNVNLIGVDLSQVATEVGLDKMLDEFELSDIHDYVQRKLKEDE